MQNTAQQTYPESNPIPELKIAAPPLYFVGTQVRSLGRENSWEAFKDDMSVLYDTNSRWLGGRYVKWTLSVPGPFGIKQKRGGYFDMATGIYVFGRRGSI